MAAYPRPQTVAIFVISVLVVTGAYLYVSKDSQAETKQGVPLTVATDNANGNISTDTDWQSSFSAFGTSTAFQTSAQNNSAPDTSSSPSTATDLLGQDFIANYAQLEQAGLDTDSQSASDAMSGVLSDTIANLPSPTVYTLNDIHVVQSDDPATLQAYGNVIVSTISTYMPKQNEAVVATAALQSGDMSTLKQIDPIIADYQMILKILLSTPVPDSVAQYHLDLVNGASIALYNAETFRKLDTDPTQSVAAVSLEVTGLQDMETAFSSMQSYFSSVNVPFGPQ